MTTSPNPQPQVFTEQEFEALREIARQHISAGSLPTRVEFDRTDTIMRSVRLPRAMVLDAAKVEPNFSKLIEQLLWRFLGEGREYLAKGNKTE